MLGWAARSERSGCDLLRVNPRGIVVFLRIAGRVLALICNPSTASHSNVNNLVHA